MTIIHKSVLRRIDVLVILAALILTPAIGAADTQDVVFTIDPAQSNLSFAATGGVWNNYVPVSSGSDASSVSGHFLVSFDPLTSTPTSMQLIGDDGYFQQNSNIVMTSSPAAVTLTYHNLNWDFSSSVLSGSGGVFSATSTNISLLGGNLNETFIDSSSFDYPEFGPVGLVTSGQWTLQQSPAGSGNWSLSVSGNYVSSGGPQGSTETFTLDSVSTAHFGTANVASVAPTQTQADVLGGSSTTGGVSIGLSGATNGGTFSAQQIPNPTGLPVSAITAGQSNSTFSLSTGDLAAHPQIWAVGYTGLPGGQSATLVFSYDPALLPAGTDQSKLGLWHYNESTGNWTFGGTVNTANHTITFVTNSFSPFELGITAVPEPSTFVLLGLGAAALAIAGVRRRRALK